MLLGTSPALPEERLAQELALLITKADVREELDRLGVHIAAARKLLKDGGAVGRKFDFLCQEFNREANTLCSKSSDVGAHRRSASTSRPPSTSCASRCRTSNDARESTIKRRGLMLVLSSPSGAGKTDDLPRAAGDATAISRSRRSR